MARAESINFKAFMNGDYKQKKEKWAMMPLASTAPAMVVVTPNFAYASNGIEGTFHNIYEAVMRAFDAGVVVVIIFSGAAWMLGHRSKAIEILIGVACGYLLARHAVDIRDLLKAI